MELTDGMTLTLGATTTGLIVKEILAWLRTRHQRATIKSDPSPFPITGEVKQTKDPKYVTAGEFNERMKKVDGDIAGVRGEISSLRSDITNSNRAVIAKLDEIDKRSEDRACALNRRIDPLIEKVAANSEAVDFIKKAAIDATVGGKKR